jgi:CubicO group peptidase (beta-lactamase class C family)
VIRVGLEPGNEFRESGGSYTLLQLIVEEVSGHSFNDYMRSAVFVPLGMMRTTHSLNAGIANIADLYDADGKPSVHTRFTALAAASLFTSAADMTRFIQVHATGPNGEPAGRGVLTPKTLDEIRRVHATEFKFVNWGLGPTIYASDNAVGSIIGHDANNDPALSASARVEPQTGSGVVVLQSGNELLAAVLAGEWVLWQTGHRDYVTVLIELRGLLKVLAFGWIAIPVMAVILGWASRRLTPS